MSTRKTSDEKKLREEMNREMKKKDLMIRDLKEKIMRLNVDKNTMMKNTDMVANMNIIREEMRVAEKFIKEVMKDNILNYELVRDIVIEDRKMKKISTIERKKLIEKENMELLDKINFDNCNCSSCIMNKSMLWGKKDKPYLACNFQLTDRILMGMHYDTRKFRIITNNSMNKTKEITLKPINGREDILKLNIIWKKEDDLELHHVCFNNHMSCAAKVNCGDNILEISISAFLVVKAMREKKVNQILDLEAQRNMVKEDRAFCFVRVYKEIMGIEPSNNLLCNINMLTEEEEMALLTKGGDLNIYLRFCEDRMICEENHMSLEPFKDAVEMKMYMIFTPAMRDLYFFSDQDMEFELIMDIERDETTELSHLDSNSISSKYFESMYSWIVRKTGKLIGDFIINVFLKKNSNKGYSINKLTMMTNSNLSNCFLENADMEISNLMLFNMSYEMFLALRFFTCDTREFCNMVMVKDPNLMKQMMTTVKKMFLEFIFLREDSEYEFSKLNEEWEIFLQNLVSESLLNDKFHRRLFYEFKKRIFMIITFDKIYREPDFELNSYEKTRFERVLKEEKRINRDLMMMKKIIRNDKNKDIKFYQPSEGIKSLKKVDFESLKEINMMESNEWLTLFLEQEGN